MRILLIYPPPWKIPAPGQQPDEAGEGPPQGIDSAALLSGDILHIPCGLLSLASQAKRAGHSVEVLNLFTFDWDRIIRIIKARQADFFGLSCFTSNRRGTLALARLIRQLHPLAHIAVGGPHATALPRDMLERCSAIDTIVIGEGETTFDCLLSDIEKNIPPGHIPGTAYRREGRILLAPLRQRIDDLDGLAPPCDTAADHIIITTRGCPWDCSFCASTCLWGKKVRTLSLDRVFYMLQVLVNGCGQKALAFKDETFTLNRGRVLAFCRGIMERGLNFLWSCDTRADALDEELLLAMRRAGCVRISLGVESAAASVLARMCKGIVMADVGRAVNLARQLGFQVRLYMIAGAPGETQSALQESIAFVRDTAPTEAIWNPFTLFPGTRDYHAAVERGEANAESFFAKTFFELTPMLDRTDDPDARFCLDWLHRHQGLQQVCGYTAAQRRMILERLPGLHAAHLDLAAACYSDGDLAAASVSVEQALQLAYPLPGLCHNLRACIAAAAGDIKTAIEELLAAKALGLHAVVERNIEVAQRWIKAGGPDSGMPLSLDPDCSFEITRKLVQPVMPGPVA
jgi:anaerobic magnesium-protoporphyrin IX monomethyl ester cyclase